MIKEVNAIAKYVKISPYKVRRVANQIRGRRAKDAIGILKMMPQRGADMIAAVVKSAMANATNNHNMNEENLVISELLVNEGPRHKRFQPKARGRVYQIIKRTSHISVKVAES